MFCLYVDLEEQAIKILPQENNYMPQYITYDLSESEGYLRAECIATFMCLHDIVPEVYHDSATDRITFKPSGANQKAPVQLFYNKHTDCFRVSWVDKEGKISSTQGLNFKTALQFVHRPSQILTKDFIQSRFRPEIGSIP